MDPHAGIEDFLKPVIARVNGYSIGGGNHLAYFCDFTIASERATFAQVGPRVGSPAAGHWVSYLTHVVGAKKAKEIWMLCRRYSAQEALEMGLVNAVVPHEQARRRGRPLVRGADAEEPELPPILKASFREVFQPLRQPPTATGWASSRRTSTTAARPTRASTPSSSAASPTSRASRASTVAVASANAGATFSSPDG